MEKRRRIGRLNSVTPAPYSHHNFLVHFQAAVYLRQGSGRVGAGLLGRFGMTSSPRRPDTPPLKWSNDAAIAILAGGREGEEPCPSLVISKKPSTPVWRVILNSAK